MLAFYAVGPLVHGFVPKTQGPTFARAITVTSITHKSVLFLAFDPDQDKNERLARLGYSDNELQRSDRKDDEPLSVNVNIVDNVDSFSLTAVGFALIAFNFFVLANLGDGGLSGVVASIINLAKQ